MIKGTNSESVREVLNKIPDFKRHKVIEVTLDMAASMENIVKYSFPKAKLVTDRFHVQKLAFEAVQEMRIQLRWEAIEQENKEFELSKELGKKYIPDILENGGLVADTFFLNPNPNGRLHNYIEGKFFSDCIQSWNWPITYPCN